MEVEGVLLKMVTYYKHRVGGKTYRSTKKREEFVKQIDRNKPKTNRITRKDGSVVDRPSGEGSTSKDVLVSEAPQPTETTKKAPLIIGVHRREGKVTVDNIGQYLSEEQKQQVSNLTEEQGRLTANVERTINKRTGVTKQKLTLIGGATSTLDQPTPSASSGGSNLFPSSPNNQPTAPFMESPNSTREQTQFHNEPIDTSGLFPPVTFPAFTPDTIKETGATTRYEKTKFVLGEKLFTQGDTEPITTQEGLTFVPVALEVVGETAVGLAKGFVIGGVYGTAKALTVDLDNTLQGATDIISGKVKGRDIMNNLNTALTNDPAFFAGEVAFAVAGGKAIGELATVAKSRYVSFGSRVTPPETVFAESVLSGAEGLPKASSVEQSLARFAKADDVVQTSSPAKIQGKEAGLGRKGAVGIEDTGIYVTPAGEGSPYFLRIDEAGGYDSFSFNPLKGLGLSSDIPTVTRFKTTGVERLPREVVTPAGFKAVQEFQEGQIGSGKSFITKRSELGQGALERQKFPAPEDFSEGGFNIKKGDPLIESGTSEIEAVVPSKTQFVYTPETTAGKIKGFDSFTTFKGQNVAIRDTVLLTSDTVNPIPSAVTTPSTISKASKVFSGESILQESSYLGGSSSGKAITSPYNFASLGSTSTSTRSVSTPIAPVIIPSSTVGGSSTPSTPLGYKKVVIYSSTSTSPAPSSVVPLVSTGGGSGRGRSSGGGSSGGGSTPSSIISDISDGGSSGGSSIGGSSSGLSTGGSSGGGSSRGRGNSYLSSRPIYPKPYASSIRRERRSSAGFDVFVRKGGQFKKITSKGLSYNNALDFGAYNVANTARATFFVTPSITSGGKITSRAKGSFGFTFGNLKKKGRLFIEKKEKRIKKGNAGERAEITEKGIASSKRKRRLKIL